MKIEVKTKNAPEAIGAYSQAVVSNGFVFTSGQLGMKPESVDLLKGIEEQTHQVMKNLRAVLEASGSDMSKVVKTTIFLADINDFAVVNKIYKDYFLDGFPARSAYQVGHLPKSALVEIEAVAAI